MASSDPKKDREAFFVRKFFEVRPELRTAEPIDAECPDFLMLGTKRIGIEVVRIQGSARVSKFERYPRSALDVAHKAFLRGGGPPLLVTVSWHRLKQMPPIRADEAGRRLASMVRAAIVGFGTEFILGNDPHRIEEAGLTRVLSGLTIERFCPPVDCWRAPSAVFWRPNQPRVQELLTQKSEKLRNYELCDEHWLLMVAEGREQSSRIDCKRVAAVEYNFAFNRAFVMELWTKEVFELTRKDITSTCAVRSDCPTETSR